MPLSLSGASAASAGRVTVFRRYSQGGALAPLHWRQIRTALDAMLDVPADSCGCGSYTPTAVELFLLDDAAVAKANARHLGCAGPTNVLSFPGGTDAPGVLLLSLDTLQRECLLYGQDPSEHAIRLLAHGMGHLCGLDHGPVMDALCEQFMDAAWAALCSEEA
mgnify:CR=1 FL=1